MQCNATLHTNDRDVCLLTATGVLVLGTGIPIPARGTSLSHLGLGN